MISIIVRTKNEEKWILSCLKKIKEQKVDDDIEVILVDNLSSDKTVEKAINFMPEIKLVTIKKYLPGASINEGIKFSNGKFIAILSAHCLPASDEWLQNLKNSCMENDVAGVYGRQLPMEYSSDSDKRDLLITFGLDRRIQIKDSFFHNANSMIKRNIWEELPFDELATNIEDRIWGQEVINRGYKLVYEPDAPVYHYHGIHQSNKPERLRSTVKIMHEYQTMHKECKYNPINANGVNIVAIIPIKGDNNHNSLVYNKEFIKLTIDSAKKSKYINEIYISTDDKKIAKFAEEFNIQVVLREEYLSDSSIRFDEVLQYSLHKLEENKKYPEIIVSLEIFSVFRHDEMIDNMIEKLINEGLDSVVAGYNEYRPTWSKKDSFIRVDDYKVKRSEREPLHIGLQGLGCVTYASLVRDAKRIGGIIGIYETNDPLCTIEIRNNENIHLLQLNKG